MAYFTDVRAIGTDRKGRTLIGFTLVSNEAVTLSNGIDDGRRAIGDRLRAARDERFGAYGTVNRGVRYAVYATDMVKMSAVLGENNDSFDIDFTNVNSPVMRSHSGKHEFLHRRLTPDMIIHDVPVMEPFFASDHPSVAILPEPVPPPPPQPPPPIVVPPQPPIILPPISSLRAELEQMAARLAELAKRA